MTIVVGLRTTLCVCAGSLSCPTVLWPHGLKPARLLCLWDFAGNNTGVVAISYSRGSSWLEIKGIPLVFPELAGGFFTAAPPGRSKDHIWGGKLPTLVYYILYLLACLKLVSVKAICTLIKHYHIYKLALQENIIGTRKLGTITIRLVWWFILCNFLYQFQFDGFKPWVYFFTFLLDYNWFTMLCFSQMYSKVSHFLTRKERHFHLFSGSEGFSFTFASRKLYLVWYLNPKCFIFISSFRLQ